MAKIERKVVTGVGNQTVDSTGWGYARLESDGSPITISLQGTGGYSKDFGNGDRILIPSSITALKVTAFTGKAWKLHMQKTIPAVNQSEIKFSITETGKLIVEGDDDIVFRGQDVDPATVSIAGINDDIENLSKLYMTALVTGTITDAAKYCKLKTAVLARYAN
ncbi:hypothetical protein KW850_28985 [Bacillus sp. sid0103]|uniref:hypothetical protein n=1 Tax=Bacillus sp. sid0103 TaxID=2856337 RepID=UPI001C466647|nr:hypothetical protein [Bacillus sp. sid0103]MBV7509213.1 hypothetical protein [Bacillus sp. sid0103]